MKFVVLVPFCLGAHRDVKEGDIVDLPNDGVTRGFVHSGRLAPAPEAPAPQGAPVPDVVQNREPTPSHREPRRGQKENR